MSEQTSEDEKQPVKNFGQFIDMVVEEDKKAGGLSADGRISTEHSHKDPGTIAQEADFIYDMVTNLDGDEQDALLAEAEQQYPDYEYDDQRLIQGTAAIAESHMVGWADFKRMREEKDPDYGPIVESAIADLATVEYAHRLSELAESHPQ